MNVTRVKFLIAGALLAGAVVYLAVVGLGAGGAIYKDVDEFLAERDKYVDKRMQLQGTVGEGELATDPDTLITTFELLGETDSLTVAYKGILPDLFKPGGAVVVDGRMGDDDVFQATILITKCASKYTDADDDPEPETSE